MSDNTQKTTSSLGVLHDPNRPEEGEAIVYGLVTTFDPERIVYVGATTMHPAARLHTNYHHPEPRTSIRYIILWAGSREKTAETEREWIERLAPPWNMNGGGAGRGFPIDAAEALRLYETPLSCREVADIMGCHHATVAKAIPPEKRRKQGYRIRRMVDIPESDRLRHS